MQRHHMVFSAKQRFFLKEPLFSIVKNKSKSRRLTTIKVKFTRKRHILIKLRGFRTPANNRTSKRNHHTINFNRFGIKEVAIEMHTNLRVPKYTYTALTADTLMLTGVVGLLISMFFILNSMWTSPAPAQVAAEHVQNHTLTSQQSQEDSEFHKKSVPVRVSIPDLDIDAQIIQVGINDDGTLETPGVFSDKAGWYKYSPTPGEQGPSIIVGHVDTYKGPSIFWRLSQAIIGQRIIIEREAGDIIEFIITSIDSYRQDNFYSEEVYGNTEDAELRLITCGGSFDYFSGRYSHNTVVFAELVK